MCASAIRWHNVVYLSNGIGMCGALDWRPSAAYLYILHLDGPALAWEYLRRNRDYQRDWQQRASFPIAQRWGLRYVEDPRLDARCAEPLWQHDPDALIRLTADPTHASNGFTVWSMPGHKRLFYDGQFLRLTHTVGHHHTRLALDSSVCDGQAVAYVIGADPRAAARWQAIERYRQRLSASQSRGNTAIPRPDRTALLHMRSLQALDGAMAGASHRTIATVLYGADAIESRWDSDSELRSHVRYLLRRAQTFCTTKYRELLAPLTFTAQGENTVPTDSP
jgi:hypothetical protein